MSTALPLSPAASRLARGVTATWWYTASSIVMFQAMTLLFWALPVVLFPAVWDTTVTSVIFAICGTAAMASSIPLLLEYRRPPRQGDAAEPLVRFSPMVGAMLGVAVASGVLLGVAGGSMLLAVSVATFPLCLLRWMPGLRLRVLVAIILVLAVLWMIEGSSLTGRLPDGITLVHPFFSVVLPAAAVASLWWWDVVVALDRARAAESRLAATQERLRLASDLHDLQGHHLQVIALQLELAERMLPRNPDAAAEQVRLARASVDEARAGTRALAGRFRGVPLPDELANAADLLRAAGVRVQLHVAPEATAAPADVLGPVVRESTTNVLKHGGGAWADLSLRRTADGWELRIANDSAGDGSGIGSGSGLTGIAERVGAVGGSLHTEGGETFVVVVTVPSSLTPTEAQDAAPVTRGRNGGKSA